MKIGESKFARFKVCLHCNVVYMKRTKQYCDECGEKLYMRTGRVKKVAAKRYEIEQDYSHDSEIVDERRRE